MGTTFVALLWRAVVSGVIYHPDFETYRLFIQAEHLIAALRRICPQRDPSPLTSLHESHFQNYGSGAT